MTPPSSTSEPSAGARRVIVVTGASSGLGRAAVVELARRTPGAMLVLVARRDAELQATVELATPDAAPGVEFFLHVADLLDPAQVTELVATVSERWSSLHALVNNAGVGSTHGFLHPEGLAEADRMLELNLRAPIALTHGLLPLLIAGSGTVVNVSSVAGLVGTPRSSVYSATKWGLTGWSEAIRAELAPAGVRVVCVQPGPVPTPGWPHEHLSSRPVLRVLLTSRAERVGRAITRAVEGRGSVAPVLPRTYAVIPTLRGLAPWFIRSLLDRAVRRGLHERVTGRTDEEHATP